MSAHISGSRREGTLSTCLGPNTVQFIFPWSSHSEKKKKKSCSDPQNNPKRATGRFDNGTVHWERAEDLSPQVTKQPKEKALFHTWAMPHAPDSCFLFHTELCFHIYCCKCFRATRSWRIRILTPQESRLVGDLGAPPLRREPFF